MVLTQNQFLQAKQWIMTNRTHAVLEIKVFEQWKAGTRTAVYSAIAKPTFEACSLIEKLTMFEAWKMMEADNEECLTGSSAGA